MKAITYILNQLAAADGRRRTLLKQCAARPAALKILNWCRPSKLILGAYIALKWAFIIILALAAALFLVLTGFALYADAL